MNTIDDEPDRSLDAPSSSRDESSGAPPEPLTVNEEAPAGSSVASADAEPGRAKEGTRRPQSPMRVVAEYGGLAVVAIALAFLIRTFLGLAFYIPSESMFPTLKVRDRVVVSRVAYRLHDPRRGDVVVFDNPESPDDTSSLPVRVARSLLEVVGVHQPQDRNLIKRIIGLPGETIEGHDNAVWINGRQLIEPYLAKGVITDDFAQVVIPEDRIFVMGDNRTNSKDSRFIGTIDRDKIVGRAFVRLWPPQRIAFL